MRSYQAYLPTEGHEDCEVARIDYYPERNAAVVREAGQPETEYGSVLTAIEALAKRYSGVYVEEA